ncbi:hypothetical protein ACIHIX_01175 [Streptomyces sp. NPDC051913]|uniref:hypothetical protein n=1 Tax=Streptomyces sp. NPDC051913 TaxID=3365676 RepID=UPI0037D475C9
MTTAQTEGLIGMLTVLAILFVLVLPSVIGIARDRRIDREIREAEQSRPKSAAPQAQPRRRYVTATVTHRS